MRTTRSAVGIRWDNSGRKQEKEGLAGGRTGYTRRCWKSKTGILAEDPRAAISDFREEET
jgi:hypothetical protein